MVLFPGGLDGKESACNAGHLGFIPGSGRSPGEENGNQLQYSCLEDPKDRGIPWNYRVRYDWATHTCARAHTHTHTHTHFHIHKGAQQRFARALSKTQTKASSHFVLKWDFKFFLCIVLLFCDQRIPCSWYNMWKLQINFKKPKSGIYSRTSYC